MNENLTNLFQLSKTLRFELKPIGKTAEFISEKGLLSDDEKRADDYKIVKKILDKKHQEFITKSLSNFQFDSNLIETYFDLFCAKDKEKAKELDALQLKLRKSIVKQFSDNKLSEIWGKNTIENELNSIAESEEEKKAIESFKGFTTYFKGFNENRKNMYSDKAQTTAVAYRIVNENLPRMFENIQTLNKVVSNYPDFDFNEVENEIDMIIQGQTLHEILSVSNISEFITKDGILKYNSILGGHTFENGKKIKGLNEYLNLYKQAKNLPNRTIPRLKELYKQILADRESISFVLVDFDNDSDLLEAIQSFHESVLITNQKLESEASFLMQLKTFLNHLNDFDLEKVFIKNDTSLTDLSQAIYGNWNLIKNALIHYYETQNPIGKARTQKYDDNLSKWLNIKTNSHFSIGFIQESCNNYISQLEVEERPNSWTKTEWISYLSSVQYKNEKQEIEGDLFEQIENRYEALKEILNIEIHGNEKVLSNDDAKVAKIKAYLDRVKQLERFLKNFHVDNVLMEKDESFYVTFQAFYSELVSNSKLYDKVRNYLTRKPYSDQKIKLNFSNGTLLDGWDVNKESDNYGVLLKDGKQFYLAIMDKHWNKSFKSNLTVPKDDLFYEKIDYKLLPGPNKMLPKVFFSAKNIAFYSPSQEIIEIRNHGRHSKNGEPQKGFEKQEFNVKDCHKMIDFFKDSISKHPEWGTFGFQFSATKSYDSIDQFYREVEKQGYKLSFRNISKNYIDTLVNDGKLYLFKIHNKDFSEFSKGKKNLHTLYWNALFDETNLKNVCYKLNGEAEVFFRKKSVFHSEEKMIKGHHYEELKDKFNYPIIKDKRFTEDKFHFHVPITMNFNSKNVNRFNNEVNTIIKSEKDLHYIGIDRGERHLLYITLVNSKGELVLQKSLNTIDTGYKEPKNYHSLLDKKEKERLNSRQTWKNINTIKEIKEGYLSQVVHEIAKLIVEYKAVVVLEDLNAGFKRGRQKVEKQVYQKFEKMLIDKLNFLSFKDKQDHELGGIYNAYQLTSSYEANSSYVQNGVVFYVRPDYTSKIDPNSGFVNYFDTKYYSVEKAQQFFSKFKNICFNPKEDYFEFTFDYNQFTHKASESQSNWTVCSHGSERWRYNPQTKQSERVNVSAEFKLLFDKHNISFGYGNDLKSEIEKNTSKEFHKTLLHLLGLIVSLRHSESGTENDFILSPVQKNGFFYDSRTAPDSLPKDADANGAFNIALKGKLILNKLVKSRETEKLVLKITNVEWLNFIQNK